MNLISFRRFYLDQLLAKVRFSGAVLDIGGKKKNKRGSFTPPMADVSKWLYLNIDKESEPDFCCSVYEAPVEDNQFDFILMTEVLEHLEFPEKAILEAYRLLKDQGTAVFTMPFLYPVHADPFDFQRWTGYKLEKELEKAGFSQIRVHPMGSVFAVIYDTIYVSLNLASKNRFSFKNRLVRKFILPWVSRFFLILDRIYGYKSAQITTGYFVQAKKISASLQCVESSSEKLYFQDESRI